jgi:hypothetical protein
MAVMMMITTTIIKHGKRTGIRMDVKAKVPSPLTATKILIPRSHSTGKQRKSAIEELRPHFSLLLHGPEPGTHESHLICYR